MLPYKVLRYKVNKAWHSCACRTYIQKIWISKLSCNKAKHPGNMLSISYSCIFLLNLERFNLPYFICFSEQPWAIKWNSENHSVSKYWSWISKKQNKTKQCSYLQTTISLTGPRGSAEYHKVHSGHTHAFNESRHIFTNWF